MKGAEREILSGIARLSEKVGNLDGRVGGIEEKFGIFLNDHNDVIRLRTQWKFLVGVSGFLGMAFATLLVHFLRTNT